MKFPVIHTALVVLVFLFTIHNVSAQDLDIQASLEPQTGQGPAEYGRLTLNIQNLSAKEISDIQIRMPEADLQLLENQVLQVRRIQAAATALVHAAYIVSTDDESQHLPLQVSYFDSTGLVEVTMLAQPWNTEELEE